jgi:hypothetical protein
MTVYEQRHPELYQDKFKRQVVMVDAEDSEDSGDDQEIAVVEWAGGGKTRVLQVGETTRTFERI